MSLKPVTIDTIHEVIPQFIDENRIIITSFEDMMDVILTMIRAKYFFAMDKQLLRGLLEDLTYMYCPGDDIHKDRVLSWLAPSDDEDDEDDDEELICGTSIEEIPTPKN